MKTWLKLFSNDLKVLMRRPESWLATILYGIMVIVIVHFALPGSLTRTYMMGSGTLWLSLILSGVIGLPRLQHDTDAIQFLPQLLTGNITPGAYFWEKVCAGFLMLLITAFIIFPLIIVLFNFNLHWDLIKGFSLIILGTFGAAVVITLCSSLTIGRESWLLPLLVFPLLLPVVLAGAELLAGTIDPTAEFPWAWLHLLISYNLLMMLGGWFLADFLWEELPQ